MLRLRKTAKFESLEIREALAASFLVAVGIGFYNVTLILVPNQPIAPRVIVADRNMTAVARDILNIAQDLGW